MNNLTGMRTEQATANSKIKISRMECHP